MKQQKKDYSIAIGLRLQQMRESLGKSQAEVAAVLGVSIGHYRKIELGTYNISVQHILRLYQEYQMDPTFLLIGQSVSFDFISSIVNCSKIERNQRMIMVIEFWANILKADKVHGSQEGVY